MKIKLVVCATVLWCASGCYWAESALKAGVKIGFDAGKEWAIAQVGAIPEDLLDGAEALVNAGVDKSMEFTAEKFIQATDAGFFAALKAVGVNPWDYDANGDGKLSEAERMAALAAAKDGENQPWWAGILLAGATLLFTGGKSARRWLGDKQNKAIANKVEVELDHV